MSDTVGGSIYGGGPGVVGGSIGGPPGAAVTTPIPTPKYMQTIGDGATLVFPITHGLGTLDTSESVYNPLTGAVISPPAYTAVHTSANVTTFTFAAAPAAGAARVVIRG